ncbi:hypothetical protein POM88_046215 [Heracleum sosnowskyi]|uniref:Uncharacterized protein n=1 Tax=Heracleum sosnowskyi TaxID=360622 RepID=A0AAD8M5Q1_9APIA|nr:hypothetical protein POM88_046215 [Heracleum sosnowskyi]
MKRLAIREFLALHCHWTLPCLVLISGLFFIPESPRWLAKMGMTEDFEVSLQVLRGFETDISLEVNEIKLSGTNGVLFYSSTIFESAGTLPCLVLISRLFFIPESPRWLAKMGMTEDFEVSLQVLRGFETDISLEVNEIKLSGTNGVLFYSSTIFESAGELYQCW